MFVRSGEFEGKNLPRPSHMRIDVTLWYRLITKGVITPNCYDGNSTISSSIPTSPSSPPPPVPSSSANDLINSSKENHSLSSPPAPPGQLRFSQSEENPSYSRPMAPIKSNSLSTELNAEEKNPFESKGPPPPVAPKPSWARQPTSTALATAVPPPSSTSVAPLIESTKVATRPAVVPLVDRHSSEKFVRSSSINQMPTTNNNHLPTNEADAKFVVLSLCLFAPISRSSDLRLDSLAAFPSMRFVW